MSTWDKQNCDAMLSNHKKQEGTRIVKQNKDIKELWEGVIFLWFYHGSQFLRVIISKT